MFTKPISVRFYDDASAGGAGGDQGNEPQKDFESWLKEQPEEIQKLYDGHVGNLKSALEKERKTNQENNPKIKRLEALEKEKADREEAVQKAEKALEDIKARNSELESEMQGMKVKSSFDLKVKELGLKFVNADAELDAFQKINAENLGENFENIEKEVKDILEKYPYYFSKEDAPDIDATKKSKAPSKSTKQKEIIESKRNSGDYKSI